VKQKKDKPWRFAELQGGLYFWTVIDNNPVIFLQHRLRPDNPECCLPHGDQSAFFIPALTAHETGAPSAVHHPGFTGKNRSPGRRRVLDFEVDGGTVGPFAGGRQDGPRHSRVHLGKKNAPVRLPGERPADVVRGPEL